MRATKTANEEALNLAAKEQHETALRVLDQLQSAGKKLPELAEQLGGVNVDHLRRMLYGKRPVSLKDLKDWEVASSHLLAGDSPDASSSVESTELALPDNPSRIEMWLDTIWEGDCIGLMNAMPEHSVDLILADLPYGTTRNKWDSIIPLDELWEAYRRVLKPTGCVVLTAAQPFTSALVMSNPDWFKYEWIWSKTIGSGQLNTTHQPLRTHESVLVFAPAKPRYNPLMEEGEPYTAVRKTDKWAGRGYNNQSDHTANNPGFRHPKSVLLVPNPRIKGGHPTQKPLELFNYLIRTYTDPGDVVLDNVMGSGTTAEAASRLGRRFVGMELDPEFVRVGRERIKVVAKEMTVPNAENASPSLSQLVAQFGEFTDSFFRRGLNTEEFSQWLKDASDSLSSEPVLFAFAEVWLDDPEDHLNHSELTVITTSQTVRLHSTINTQGFNEVQVRREECVPTSRLKLSRVKQPGVQALLTMPSGKSLKIGTQMRNISSSRRTMSCGSLGKVLGALNT